MLSGIFFGLTDGMLPVGRCYLRVGDGVPTNFDHRSTNLTVAPMFRGVLTGYGQAFMPESETIRADPTGLISFSCLDGFATGWNVTGWNWRATLRVDREESAHFYFTPDTAAGMPLDLSTCFGNHTALHGAGTTTTTTTGGTRG